MRFCGAIALGAGLWLGADGAQAQIGTSMSSPAPVGRAGTPGGVDEKDELHGFHRIIALQATNEQTNQFRAILNKTEVAEREIDALVKSASSTQNPTQNADEANSHVATMRQAIDGARTQTDAFVAGFSPEQKAGLKDTAAKLLRAGTELADQQKSIEAGGDAREEAARVAAHADGLRKALANVRTQQESLAMEMSIVVSEGAEEVAFTIPARKSAVTIGGQPVGITHFSGDYAAKSESGRRCVPGCGEDGPGGTPGKYRDDSGCDDESGRSLRRACARARGDDHA